MTLDSGLKTHYSHFYSGASEWRWLSAMSKAKNIVHLCDGIPMHKVLEVGAGDGAVLQRLSELGFGRELYALEISESAASVIRERGIPTMAGCTLFDGYRTPYRDNAFDLVILSHVVEHVEHPRLLLAEAKRIAEHVFVEVPLEYHLRTPANFKWTPTGHINLYSPLLIRQLVQSVGFQVISMKVTNSGYPVYRYQFGRRAFFRYLLKELPLRVSSELSNKVAHVPLFASVQMTDEEQGYVGRVLSEACCAS